MKLEVIKTTRSVLTRRGAQLFTGRPVSTEEIEEIRAAGDFASQVAKAKALGEKSS